MYNASLYNRMRNVRSSNKRRKNINQDSAPIGEGSAGALNAAKNDDVALEDEYFNEDDLSDRELESTIAYDPDGLLEK